MITGTLADFMPGTLLPLAGAASAPPSGLPALPPVQAGVYFVRSDGSLTADGKTRAFLTLEQANSVPAGSTVCLWGGETFLCPAGGALSVSLVLKSFGTGNAFIQANASGGGGAVVVNTPGSSVLGVKAVGDGGQTFAGIVINSAANVTLGGGGSVGGFYNPATGQGGNVVVNGPCPGLNIGGVTSSDCRARDANGKLVGGVDPSLVDFTIGTADPNGLDDNGIWLTFCTMPENNPIRIRGALVQNCGGSVANGASGQVGNGIHAAVISDTFEPSPLIVDPTTGEPTNQLIDIGGSVITNVGANTRTCGGPSGVLFGPCDRGYLHDSELSYVGPSTFPGVGCDWVGGDPADDGCTNIRMVRCVFYRCCGPGWITYTDSPNWGPVYYSYCLSVECGLFSEGSVAIQGNGNSGLGTFVHNCTVVGPPGAIQFSSSVLSLYECQALNGRAFNNIFVASSAQQFSIEADNLPGAGFALDNNLWWGGGQFSWGGNRYNDFADWKAAGNGSDQHGISVDPQFAGPPPIGWLQAYKLQPTSPCIGVGIDPTQYGLIPPKTDAFGNAIVSMNLGCDGSGGVDNPTRVAALLAYDGTIPSNPSGLPAGVTHGTFWSALTQMNLGYTIYLPPQYASEPSTRFPVVYWFSGGAGAENLEPALWLPYLQAWTGAPFIFVWVNAGAEGWAMDPIPGAPMAGIWEGQSTPTNELIPFIDATYRTRGTKGGRAIVGMSGGGAKALRIAMVRPDLFSSVYGFAPALVDIPSLHPTFLPEFFNNDIALYTPETVQNETTSNVAAISGKIAIHLTVGTADGLYTDGTVPNYDAELTSLGIPHDPLTLVQGAIHDTGQLLVGTSGTSADALAFVSGHFF